jgi:hypothetical protein
MKTGRALAIQRLHQILYDAEHSRKTDPFIGDLWIVRAAFAGGAVAAPAPEMPG